MTSDIRLLLHICVYLCVFKASRHQVRGQLIEYHSTPETWYDANRICSEGLASLITDNAQTFAAVRANNSITSNQIWSGLYWRDTGSENILLDVDCQSPDVLGVDRSGLSNTNPTNSSQRCVLLDFTTSPTFATENCDVKLPFACEAEAVLEAGTFTKFYFDDGYQTAPGISARDCQVQCLENTALPCLSLIYTGAQSYCTMLPTRDSLGITAAWNVNWQSTSQHYKVQLYTDKFSSSASGNVFNNLDTSASLVGGSFAAVCQLKCAWLNNLCACADYQNGKCRLFNNSLLCSSLLPSGFSDSQTFIKTAGDLKALYINSIAHTVSTTDAGPPQLSCPLPSSLLLSPATSYITSEDVSSTDQVIATSVPLTVSVDSSITSEFSADGVITSVSTSVIPSSSLDETLSVFPSFSSVSAMDTHLISTPDLTAAKLAKTTSLPDEPDSFSLSTELKSTKNLITSPKYLNPSPTIDLAHKTYFISKSGSTKSTKFECDVITALTVKLDVTSTLANYECKMVMVITRSLADNDTSFIEKVVEELSIDEKEISSYKRKYISAHDSRPSARNVGILGIAMLALVFGGLLLLDLSTIKRDIHMLLDNIRSK